MHFVLQKHILQVAEVDHSVLLKMQGLVQAWWLRERLQLILITANHLMHLSLRLDWNSTSHNCDWVIA